MGYPIGTVSLETSLRELREYREGHPTDTLYWKNNPSRHRLIPHTGWGMGMHHITLGAFRGMLEEVRTNDR